jgi:hypothetical protein
MPADRGNGAVVASNYGESETSAYLLPISVDGLIVVASLVGAAAYRWGYTVFALVSGVASGSLQS